MPDSAGLRFILYEPGTVAHNPNLNLTIEKLPAEANISRKKYGEINREKLKKLVHA